MEPYFDPCPAYGPSEHEQVLGPSVLFYDLAIITCCVHIFFYDHNDGRAAAPGVLATRGFLGTNLYGGVVYI